MLIYELQIERYEETLAQIQAEYEKTQEQYRRAHADVSYLHSY